MRIKDTLWAWREELVLLVLLGIAILCSQLLPDVLLPFLVSLALAYLFIPVIRFLERGFRRFTRRPEELRAYAVTFFFLTGFMVALLALIPLIFGLISQLHDIRDALSKDGVREYAQRAADFIDSLKSRALQFPYLNESVEVLQASREKIVESVTRTLGRVGEGARVVFAATAQGLLASLGHMFSWALVPILLFYMLLDWERIVRIFFLLIPESYAPWTRSFAAKVDQTLRN
jgi:predicted PurR-regulated permease PerM